VYKVDWASAPAEDLVTLLRPVFISWVIITTVAYIYRAGVAGRLPSGVVLMTLPLACAYAILWRLVLRRLAAARLGARARKAVLAVGFSSRSLAVLQALLSGREELAGVLSDSWDVNHSDFPCRRLGRLKDIGRVLEEQQVDEVVVEGHEMHNGNASAVLKACETAGVALRVVPTMLSMLTSRAHVEMVGFVPTISYGPLRIEGWNALGKRLIDAALALVLFALLAPALVFCAVWIALDSRGGFLFRQRRVGKDGRLFTCYKFRTMSVGAEASGPLTRRDDPRVTRAGRFLRKWSLDELPQLANVLLGDMSLVGPRAVVPYVANQFDEFERITLNVLPGITGLAQVNGRDELAFKDKSLLNLYYITNYSLLLDIEIMVRTLGVVIRREGTNGTRTEAHPAPAPAAPVFAARAPVEAGNAV
jgi:exopolysaccharide biosynthesis polyprenyl glycosylphosphotransferase